MNHIKLLVTFLTIFFASICFGQQNVTYEHFTYLQKTYANDEGKVKWFHTEYSDRADDYFSDELIGEYKNLLSEEVITGKFTYTPTITFAYATLSYRHEYENGNRTSPTNLTADINWDDDPGMAGEQTCYSPANSCTPAQVAAAFNNARLAEEADIVTSGTITPMPVPTGLTGDDLSFFLANDDRTSRDGVVYSNGAALGLPFEDGEANMDGISEWHKEDMLANDYWGHTDSNMNGPFERIDNDPVIGLNGGGAGISCHEEITRAENLAIFAIWGASSIAAVRERSQYNWVYDDASSGWGHREASLLQDVPLGGPGAGYTNNHGPTDSEGFIGFAEGGDTGADYNPQGWTDDNDNPPDWVHITVFNEFDPVNNPNCNYTLLVLPVELISFNGYRRDRMVELNWTTASEENNDYFLLERSLNGRDFDPLAKIEGFGTTSEINHYRHYDEKPSTGTNYYRLTQVDYDGTQHIQSKIVAVEYMEEAIATIVPNPSTTGAFSIHYLTEEPGEVQVEIFDLNGRALHYGEVLAEKGNNVFPYALPQLATGVYLVRLGRSTGVQTLRFVKAR